MPSLELAAHPTWLGHSTVSDLPCLFFWMYLKEMKGLSAPSLELVAHHHLAGSQHSEWSLLFVFWDISEGKEGSTCSAAVELAACHHLDGLQHKEGCAGDECWEMSAWTP